MAGEAAAHASQSHRVLQTMSFHTPIHKYLDDTLPDEDVSFLLACLNIESSKFRVSDACQAPCSGAQRLRRWYSCLKLCTLGNRKEFKYSNTNSPLLNYLSLVVLSVLFGITF
ncbi:hypothetical protein GYMLUDRAFT_909286 [Collybiopsis luxurians FD-317 M1]|nr:hypothetical protein GYMLUDRAFT_909286 [Collybiopsis luxurians FD-317 M1]